MNFKVGQKVFINKLCPYPDLQGRFGTIVEYEKTSHFPYRMLDSYLNNIIWLKANEICHAIDPNTILKELL